MNHLDLPTSPRSRRAVALERPARRARRALPRAALALAVALACLAAPRTAAAASRLEVALLQLHGRLAQRGSEGHQKAFKIVRSRAPWLLTDSRRQTAFLYAAGVNKKASADKVQRARRLLVSKGHGDALEDALLKKAAVALLLKGGHRKALSGWVQAARPYLRNPAGLSRDQVQALAKKSPLVALLARSRGAPAVRDLGGVRAALEAGMAKVEAGQAEAALPGLEAAWKAVRKLEDPAGELSVRVGVALAAARRGAGAWSEADSLLADEVTTLETQPSQVAVTVPAYVARGVVARLQRRWSEGAEHLWEAIDLMEEAERFDELAGPFLRVSLFEHQAGRSRVASNLLGRALQLMAQAVPTGPDEPPPGELAVGLAVGYQLASRVASALQENRDALLHRARVTQLLGLIDARAARGAAAEAHADAMLDLAEAAVAKSLRTPALALLDEARRRALVEGGEKHPALAAIAKLRARAGRLASNDPGASGVDPQFRKQVFASLTELTGQVGEGKFAEALKSARELRAMLVTRTPVDPMILGWIRYYEFKSRYSLRRHDEAYAGLRAKEQYEYLVPLKNEGYMYSVASELALRLGRPPQEILEWGEKCWQVRVETRDLSSAIQNAGTICFLMRLKDREDLAAPFARRLVDMGKRSGHGALIHEGYRTLVDGAYRAGEASPEALGALGASMRKDLEKLRLDDDVAEKVRQLEARLDGASPPPGHGAELAKFLES